MPLVASPKAQLYVAVASAVLLLASKLHVSPEQLDVKRATGAAGGGGGGGGVPMNAVW